MRAIFNGVVIAESDDTVVVDNAHYFPRDTLLAGCFHESDHTSYCGWKGHCKYYHVEIAGERSENAIWYYPEPFAAAKEIEGRVAFWKGVEVVA